MKQFSNAAMSSARGQLYAGQVVHAVACHDFHDMVVVRFRGEGKNLDRNTVRTMDVATAIELRAKLDEAIGHAKRSLAR